MAQSQRRMLWWPTKCATVRSGGVKSNPVPSISLSHLLLTGLSQAGNWRHLPNGRMKLNTAQALYEPRKFQARDSFQIQPVDNQSQLI